MSIRITRTPSADDTWWNAARASAMREGAPHGLHQLLLDPAVTHVDVFPTEKAQLWQWAERIPGWSGASGPALTATPFDSTSSNASQISREFLLATRPPERGGPAR
jgi:hypothetical protein